MTTETTQKGLTDRIVEGYVAFLWRHRPTVLLVVLVMSTAACVFVGATLSDQFEAVSHFPLLVTAQLFVDWAAATAGSRNTTPAMRLSRRAL